MKWRLSKKFTFEASHQLMNHDGKCARLHGHSWVGWVHVFGDRVQDDGAKTNMLVDYDVLKTAVQPLVEQYLDHHHLNETLQTDSPTSEFLARWLFDRLRPALIGLESVIIEETCTSRCEFWGV